MENTFKPSQYLELEDFVEMDYYAVEHLQLPILLMMENAGLQLARLIVQTAQPKDQILIGVGNGNNGGGGLVAARRLAAWGYQVVLDVPVPITREIPSEQYERALKFGVKQDRLENPDIWVDAYLGFSQRLPLGDAFEGAIKNANTSDAFKISLDLPTGIIDETGANYFLADQVLTLASPKKILKQLTNTQVYLGDLGLPKSVYEHFSIEMPPFHKNQLLKLTNYE